MTKPTLAEAIEAVDQAIRCGHTDHTDLEAWAVVKEAAEQRELYRGHSLNLRTALNKIAWAPHFGGPTEGDLAAQYRGIAINALSIDKWNQRAIDAVMDQAPSPGGEG